MLSKLKLSLHSASPQNAVRTSYRKDPARIRRKILENTVKRTVQYLGEIGWSLLGLKSLQLFMYYTYILHDKHKTFGEIVIILGQEDVSGHKMGEARLRKSTCMFCYRGSPIWENDCKCPQQTFLFDLMSYIHMYYFPQVGRK